MEGVAEDVDDGVDSSILSLAMFLKPASLLHRRLAPMTGTWWRSQTLHRQRCRFRERLLAKFLDNFQCTPAIYLFKFFKSVIISDEKTPTTHLIDMLLQVPHPALAAIIFDEHIYSFLFKNHVCGAETRCLSCLWSEVLFGDNDLLF